MSDYDRWRNEGDRYRGRDDRDRGFGDFGSGGGRYGQDDDRYGRGGDTFGRGSRDYSGEPSAFDRARARSLPYDGNDRGSGRPSGRDEHRGGYESGREGGSSGFGWGGSDREDRGNRSYGGGRSVSELAFGRDASGRDYRSGDDDRFGRDPRSGDYGYGRTGGSGSGYGPGGGGRDERGWFERAGDEVASWFGDEDAERRRRQDSREEERYGGQHRGRGPKSYQRSDERIRDDVNDRLTDDYRLDASEIDVAVKDREVTLTGTVGNRNDKRRAEDLAESVSGVTHVQNNLRVQNQYAGSSGFGGSGSSSGSGSFGGSGSGAAGGYGSGTASSAGSSGTAGGSTEAATNQRAGTGLSYETSGAGTASTRNTTTA